MPLRPGSVTFGDTYQAHEVRPMKDMDQIAAQLTVAFYSGRGAAMSLPQIIATYEEMRTLLKEKYSPKRGSKRKRK